MNSAGDIMMSGGAPLVWWGWLAGRALEGALVRKPGELDLSSPGPPRQKAANTGAAFRSTVTIGLRF